MLYIYNTYTEKRGSSLIKLTGIDANKNQITGWKHVVDVKLLHKLMPTFYLFPNIPVRSMLYSSTSVERNLNPNN